MPAARSPASGVRTSCVSSGSHTSSTGPVQNPRKLGPPPAARRRAAPRRWSRRATWTWRSAATRPAQSASPASFCGIVGLKPTFGLVPYTGIAPLEMTLDVCGPMTANARQCAAVRSHRRAGRHRLAPARRRRRPLHRSARRRRQRLAHRRAQGKFGLHNSEPDVDAHVRDTRPGLRQQRRDGRRHIQLPSHAEGFPVWAAIRGDAACVFASRNERLGINHGVFTS